MESFRPQDMHAEQRLGEFMDAYLYSKLRAFDGSPITFERMNDKESQLKGIDVKIDIKGKTILIDEKASIYYSNAMIPTFVFELDSIQKHHNSPVEGWFINDELETQYYMLIWPNVKCVRNGSSWVRKEVREIGKDDFTIVESMLIRKKDIRHFIEDSGYDKSRLVEYAKRIRQLYSNCNDKHEEELAPGIKIMFSGDIPEKPVNLVVSKELLKNMSKRIYLISQDGFASIKE